MIRTAGKMKDGDDWIVIFDDGSAPVWADLITELAEEDGIIRMSFAAVSADGEGATSKADVAVRLRMKSDVAWHLCRSLKALEG